MFKRFAVLFLAILAWSQTAQAQTFVAPTGVQSVNSVFPVNGNVTIPTTQFVATCTPSSPCTVANILSTYPCSATWLGYYADANNLYNGTSTSTAGGIDDIIRCRYDATNAIYSWTPQREAFNSTNTTTSGAISIIPLVTAPTVRMTGTLLGGVTITPTTTNAYIGQRVRIVVNNTLGAFLITLTGLVGSNVSLLGGTATTIEYGTTGWFQSGS